MNYTEVGNRQWATCLPDRQVGNGNIQRCLLVFAYCLLILAPQLTLAQKAVPELWGQRVHDDAHILKQETIDALEQRLKLYQDSTSNQIAILTVTSLDGEVLEEYSLKVAEAWKLGQKDKDNGVLLLIAVDDHEMRIEVGHGLEGVLTDAHSNRIIRNEMTPHFRKSEFDEGINAAVDAMIKAIAGEYSADGDSDEWSATDFVLLIGSILFFGFIIGYAFYKEAKNPSTGTTSGGSRSSSRAGTFFSGGRSSSGGSSFSGGGGSFGGGGSSGSW